jgi:hypothetical protein
MGWNPNGKMESRKRHAWQIACETAVVTKEDALQVYERLMRQFEELDPLETSGESNKTH